MEIARGERERKVLQRNATGHPQVYEPLRTGKTRQLVLILARALSTIYLILFSDLPHPVPDNVFEEFCHRIGIERYKIEETPTEPKNALDLRPCDLYWEDIRIERNMIVKEVKQLPKL